MKSAMLFAGFFICASVCPSSAVVIYPWCSNNKLGVNCGFTSFKQCVASARGNGHGCRPNPRYEPFPPLQSGISQPIWKNGPAQAPTPISRLQNTR
jgi:hypothetical protein